MDEPVLSEIRLGADPAAWRECGFAVAGERSQAGSVALAFLAGEGGIVDWALSGARSAGIDGLPTRLGEPAEGSAEHPNGVTGIDHIVVLTPQLERTTACLEEAGIRLRRRREGETGMGPRRQAFFRLGEPILEVVEAHELGSEEPARFWGITFVTDDLDRAAGQLGDKLGRVKDAIQPGRRIATVRREARLRLPVALISS